MCFTPTISLLTAIIEFVLAGVLIWKYPRTRLRDFFAIFIIVLGFYQFTEFMLCSFSNPKLWASIGVITFSLLPALALHGAMATYGKKVNLSLVYIVPILVAFVVLVTPNFIVKASCTGIFINIQSIMTLGTSFATTLVWNIYLLWYFVFIAYATWMAYEDYHHTRSEIRKEIDLAEIVGILLMTVPTFIFIILFPFLGIRFPSVLCQFAIFVAVAAFIGAHLEARMNRKLALARKRRRDKLRNSTIAGKILGGIKKVNSWVEKKGIKKLRGFLKSFS